MSQLSDNPVLAEVAGQARDRLITALRTLTDGTA